MAVAIAAVALLIGIGLTVLSGDRAGVNIIAFSPTAIAHSTAPVRIQFGEAMDLASVESHFQIDPTAEGTIGWSGTQMTFRPRQAWSVGVTYTVTLGAGATAAGGRRLVEPLRFSFEVAPPQIAYLAPAVPDGGADTPPNLWVADPAHPEATRQITFSTAGVEDFRPAPDGEHIAYTIPGPRGTADLYMLNLASGDSRRLTNCAAVEARCHSPEWSPDGTRIVYARIELSRDLPVTDRDVPRAWIVHLRDLSTAPLLSDPLALGAAPRWSPDGTHIALFDRSLGSIAVYDLTTGARLLIPTLEGESGDFAFDPSGERFAYPQLVMMPGRFTSRLELVYLNDPARGIVALTDADGPPTEDKLPAWHPDGERLAVTRRYMDGSGPPSAQVYLLDPVAATAEPLVIDAEYFHGAIAWDPSGERLLMQRLPVASPQPVPGVWVLEVATGRVVEIARNGYLPAWIP